LETRPHNAKNLDFIFVLEISSYNNQTRLSSIKVALQKLLDTTSSSNYGDFSPRFAFAFYLITANHNQLVVTKFKKFYSHEDIDTLFDKAVNYAVPSDHYTSTNSLRYITVLRSLQVLSNLTGDKPSALSIESNKMITLNFRKNSEKHLIIFLDLFEKQKQDEFQANY